MSYKKHGQFICNYTNVQKILGSYGIDDFTFSTATSGIENSTLIVHANIDDYALRVYRQNKKTLEDINNELTFMHLLKSQGLPVPGVRSSLNGEKVVSIELTDGTWEAILMEYVSGYHTEEYSEVLIKNLASFQARMHLLGIEFAQTIASHVTLSSLEETEFIGQIKPKMVKNKQTAALIERVKNYSVRINPLLPSGYSHFDYDAENVLVDESDTITGILDFDDMQYAPVVMCLAYTLWAVLFTTDDIDSVNKYLHFYELIRPLSAQEKQSIIPIVLFRHYALASLFVLRGEMKQEELSKFLRLEEFLKTNYDLFS